jgi:hypothetical protein
VEAGSSPQKIPLLKEDGFDFLSMHGTDKETISSVGKVVDSEVLDM